MIEKIRKVIMQEAGWLDIIEEIEKYLYDVRELIKKGKYTLSLNDNRIDNKNLIDDYVVDSEIIKSIIFDLDIKDFSEKVKNEKEGRENEILYIFGKEVKLLERYGIEEVTVPLYIKFNKLGNNYVIIISFHKQKYPIRYFFK